MSDTMEAQSITFALKDHAGGFETNPQRVRLGDLARFADDVLVFCVATPKKWMPKTWKWRYEMGLLPSKPHR